MKKLNLRKITAFVTICSILFLLSACGENNKELPAADNTYSGEGSFFFGPQSSPATVKSSSSDFAIKLVKNTFWNNTLKVDIEAEIQSEMTGGDQDFYVVRVYNREDASKKTLTVVMVGEKDKKVYMTIPPDENGHGTRLGAEITYWDYEKDMSYAYYNSKDTGSKTGDSKTGSKENGNSITLAGLRPYMELSDVTSVIGKKIDLNFKDGEDGYPAAIYKMDGLELEFKKNPEISDQPILTRITTTKYPTSNGIKVGDSIEDVNKIYPDAAVSNDVFMDADITSDTAFSFDLDSGTITSISYIISIAWE